MLKYTTEDELNEIMRRSRIVTYRRERRKVTIQAGLTGLFSLMMVVVLIFLPQGSLMTSKESVYGSFLLAKESGGYVLIALLGFILGIMVTFLCVKFRRLRDLEKKEENNSKG